VAIRLPRDAREYDYEDQVCSILLAHGYYMETRLVLKHGVEEVLEFDAIATPVNDYQDRKIVEVKSGDWGVPDLFKLYGQTMYTRESAAWLIHKKPAGSETKRRALSEIMEKAPVTCIHVDLDTSLNVDVPTGLELPQDVISRIFVSSWWSRSADRIAQTRFRKWARSQEDPTGVISSARTYLASISDCLFKSSPLRRVDALYDAYKAAPQLTSKLIQHVADTSKESILSVRKSVFDTESRPHLQYVAAQEYRARVAIMKNAYDALLEEAEAQDQEPATFRWTDFIKGLLPGSFKGGMEALRTFPYAHHVPFFLQVFVEVFGGYYFPDDERDVAFLSEATGIPVQDIPAALDLVDAFFPIQNGWIHDGKGVRWLKGVPAYLRGSGCFARGDLYGKEWAKQFPQLSYNISRWHNALYRLLEPSLKVEPGA
jgi:hypothetical protein